MDPLPIIALVTIATLFGLAWHDQPARNPEKTSLPEIPVMPIFDPRTWYTHRASTVQREIAVAQYEKVIQSAFREVATESRTKIEQKDHV